MMMKSKKSAGYSPKYGEGWPSFGGPLIKVWKIVKKMLPFFGTFPFLRMSSGAIRTIDPGLESSNAENALYAWLARMFRSARKRIRGLRDGSRLRFQRL